MSKVSLDLTGKWEFKEYPASARRMRDLDSADWLETNVPCSVFGSLIAAGRIKQSDIDAQPEEFGWVSEKPWIYRKVFDATDELLNSDRVELVFDGLDTIADIWLNDKLIGKTNNMFVPFRFDVTKFLKAGNNSLLVKFESATQYAKRLMDRYTTFSESDFNNPYRVYIRKAQYQFGWDWCPPLPGCGIWRAVHLEGTKKSRIADLHVSTVDCNKRFADVKIAVTLDTVTEEEFLCRLTLSCGQQIIEHNLVFDRGEESQSTVIRIENPQLWWPAGYGRQSLYNLELVLLAGDEIIDRIQKRIGIRMAKVNRSPDEYGEKFQFEINGQPVFAKGANWVPPSIFAGQLDHSDYKRLLSAAADANINMLRVWGGGYYEAEEFYELCSEFGIMVWQDFMFACAYYPDRQWFLNEVEKEAVITIKRLRNHPCLVLWCGNNEIDWLHYRGCLGKGKKLYGKAIYHRLLPQVAAELDADTDYIPTTPLGGKKEFETGRTLTTHNWDIWSGHQPVRQYQCPPEDMPRFVTEFGMQSMPSMETVRKFCPAEQLRIGSYPIEKHNYQVDGSSRLCRYTGDLFGAAESIEELVYFSQVTQARGIKTYVEHLRAHNYRNGGVLFWQLNDCCPATSWSAIDVTGEPKALYYYAKRFFSKLLIAVVSEPVKSPFDLPLGLRPLRVAVINDGEQPITATLNCRLIDLFGRLLDHIALPVAIGPFRTLSLTKLAKTIISPAHPEKSCLHLVLDKDGEKIAENLFFYLPDKYIDWPKTEISRSFSQITEKQWKLKLKSNAIAKDVQISAIAPAQFSDNFIDLIPPDEFEITIDAAGCDTYSIESALQLRCLKSVL
ncbi:MAG: sugar-binding domain-containing protein [Phycisphaerae bacterium]|jgi:beta-mannosidase